MSQEGTLTREELVTSLIEQFSNLQEIKRENGTHENKVLDYQIKVVTAKLASLSVNVEDLTL
ncbi:MAG: hypothetical protein IK016_02085 [Lachnospiraceae bacterium]|nr:hypothetical protein [Lachnospiraceae bacterium]